MARQMAQKLSQLEDRFREEERCPLCLAATEDWMTFSCGHSCCSACVRRTFDSPQPPYQCPLCKGLSGRPPLPDHRLATVVKVAKTLLAICRSQQRLLQHSALQDEQNNLIDMDILNSVQTFKD